MGRARIACMSRVTCTHLQSCRHAREQKMNIFTWPKCWFLAFPSRFIHDCAKIRKETFARGPTLCTYKSKTLYITSRKSMNIGGGKGREITGFVIFLIVQTSNRPNTGKKKKIGEWLPFRFLLNKTFFSLVIESERIGMTRILLSFHAFKSIVV